TMSPGIVEREMPQWGQVLSLAEIRDLVAYLRSWGTQAGGTPGTPGDLGRGTAVYAANCAVCIVGEGEGRVGPRLNPNNFISTQSEAALLAFIEAGRPGTAMAGYAGRLSAQALAGLIAFLRAWTREPAPPR